MFGTVRRNAQKLAQLIEDLLAFSRAGRRSIQRERVDMVALCHSVFDEQHAARADQRVEFTLDELPPAWGDPAALRQVVTNLLANALKFTSQRELARIHVGATQDADETRYEVRDNGAGFEAEYTDKLFQVFTRLHDQDEFPGTGIGLAIVRRIINKHDGRVWATSDTDEGACFGFALPRRAVNHNEKEKTP